MRKKYAIYKENCAFFRSSEGGRCKIKKHWCFMCLYEVPEIPGLRPADYVFLANSKQATIITFWLSLSAIIIALAALCVGILTAN